MGVRASDYPYFAERFTALAHRGGSLLADNIGHENTLRAFGNAVSLGYTHIETDVHATRDGQLVAFHDSRLDRVTEATGLISELPLSQVRRATVGGEPIPTLDEVLDAFPDTFVNIDIKESGATEPLVGVLRRHNATRRVCVGSFGSDRLIRFRQLMGREVATAVGPVGVAWSAIGRVVSRVLPPAGVAFQMPVRTRIAGLQVPLVTPAFLRAAHARGRAVHVWTINDRAEMNRLIDMGVDGIVTDAIEDLADVMTERGLVG
ncbi:MAG: glycerophosphodiester phosphodiesterase [Acidipropionibacterium jensenii]|nr:glycerophosphodiester phosphodiesterase [Acidipropionibacterium jensenii]MDN5976246.1 glycerophosphodiester phosphodiesterase [Acidipropionibacterium jensenii]MDN5996134.1 glycerophosphodiester phosphodiesterase [Acidipropionibacterium jensenii]MDN6427443.1 glycerophosphodiester phosphodiesterase [Acidipropionibacterium jensenii]MDN6442053.1 glycerophosphodiester phosphodiesterase [Acidipropionibacterium jensenii]MDN6480099.1 glycerophosphodiester phosphodiesterase [Acidipropionibacterium j